MFFYKVNFEIEVNDKKPFMTLISRDVLVSDFFKFDFSHQTEGSNLIT